MAKHDLTRWRLFADITQDDAEFILSNCKETVLVGGEDVFAEGDPGDSIWIVESGRVEVVKPIRAGIDRVLASLGPGDAIGEVSFIDGASRSAGARTTEASELLELTHDAFTRVVRERPTVAAAFYRNIAAILAGRLRTTNDLYRESERFGLEAAGAVGLNLKGLAENLRAVTLHLAGGDALTGRILQMDNHPAGWAIALRDDHGKVALIPYHAIQRIDLG